MKYAAVMCVFNFDCKYTGAVLAIVVPIPADKPVKAIHENMLYFFWGIDFVIVIDRNINVKIKSDIAFFISGYHLPRGTSDELILKGKTVAHIVLHEVDQINYTLFYRSPFGWRYILKIMHNIRPLFPKVIIRFHG